MYKMRRVSEGKEWDMWWKEKIIWIIN
jgi:hypothetical protein